MRKNKGFTLIELLIVISIIAILAALAIFGIGRVFEKSRNTQRKSDLRQYQNALEVYANSNNGMYPSRTSHQDAATLLCTTDLGLTGCPDDPVDTQNYQYTSDGNGNGFPTASVYFLWADMEDGEWGESTEYVVCSNGQSGECNDCGDDIDETCPL